jgi:hypothetical protein
MKPDVYGSIPEPDMLWFCGLLLFLDVVGAGKAGVPFAILPFFALRWAMASCKDRCSMWRNLELTI